MLVLENSCYEFVRRSVLGLTINVHVKGQLSEFSVKWVARFLSRTKGESIMATNLFVGGLPYSVDDAQLEEAFAAIGAVKSAKVIVDRDTNRSKGFGFVEMEGDDDAKKAIDQLNNSDMGGRSIIVNEARPREERPRRDDRPRY